ncbi:MAG TPA: SH3 domain-containing protein [Symbiobacteriaceae bacterium]|nr:SH3 domain-containing protein [Symbiobacteriaceae bacterium]
MKNRTAMIAALLATLLATAACSRPQPPVPAPAPSPAPSPAALEPDGSILVKSDGGIRHTTPPIDKPIAPTDGLYTMDPASGRIDAWTPAEPGSQEDLMPLFVSASDDGHWVTARTRDKGYVMERNGPGAFMYQRSQYELVAASAGALAFEHTDPAPPQGQGFAYHWGPTGHSGNGKFTVLGADLTVRTTFTLPVAASHGFARTALINRDGSKLALSEGKLYLIDLATGQYTEHKSDSGIGSITPGPGGSSFTLRPAPATDAPPLRYDWKGNELPLLTPTIRKEWAGTFTPTLVFSDAATGAPKYRVLGADTCYGYAMVGNPWTADGAAAIFHGRDGFYQVTADGELSKPPTFNSAEGWHQPFPSPTDPNLFADLVSFSDGSWQLGIADGSASLRNSVTFSHAVPGLWPVGPLWHPTGAFVQMSLFARGGTGAPCGDFRIPLAPAVQKAPFPAELTLEVTGTGDCLNVREGPSRGARILTCLKDGTRVTVADDASQAAQTWGDGGQWARVRTPDGPTGWASVEDQFLKWVN